MILDERLEFADAVSVVGAAGTALIGDVIDLQVARDIGNGEPMYFAVTVDTEIVAGSAGTIAFALASDAQAAIATDGSATVHYQSAALVTNVAASERGILERRRYTVFVSLPLEGAAYERYLGVLAIVGGVATTAGKINAFLTLDQHGWKAYADAQN